MPAKRLDVSFFRYSVIATSDDKTGRPRSLRSAIKESASKTETIRYARAFRTWHSASFFRDVAGYVYAQAFYITATLREEPNAFQLPIIPHAAITTFRARRPKFLNGTFKSSRAIVDKVASHLQHNAPLVVLFPVVLHFGARRAAPSLSLSLQSCFMHD